MHDCVVIGAGLAGASATLRLTDAGKTVAVVEARGRVGGRTYSRGIGHSTDIAEFGGSWITPWHERMKALAKRFNVGLRPTLPVSQRRWHDGQVLRSDTPVAAEHMAAFAAGMEAIQNDSMAMHNSGGRWHTTSPWMNKSFAEYMEAKVLPASVKHEFMAWWAISGSADITKVNVLDPLYFASHRGGTMDGMMAVLTHTIEGGVGTLTAQALAASGAEMILGDAAVEVHDKETHVKIRLSSGRMLQARQVIAAVPVNAIKTIRFEPALRTCQTRLAAEGHQGRAIKMLLRAAGVEPGMLVTGEAEGLRFMFAERALSDGATLVIGFGLYDEVKDTSFAAMSRALRTFFPEATLLEHDWHDWVRDPYSCGTWVSHGIGQSRLFAAEEWAARGRVHFATSDIASSESGWFEGAVIAGEESASAVLENLDVKGSRA